MRDGQRRGHDPAAYDAGDQRRQLRGGDARRFEPAAGHVHRDGDGAGAAVRRRAGAADGDGRRTVGRGAGSGLGGGGGGGGGGGRGHYQRWTHTVPGHPGVQTGHGLCGVRTAPRGCRRAAARGRRVQRRETDTEPGRRRGPLSRQLGRIADGQSAAGGIRAHVPGARGDGGRRR